MALELDRGCESPVSATDRAAYRSLIEFYAPTLAFDPAEQFFPVDLPSVVAASSLHRVTGDVVEGIEVLMPDHWECQLPLGNATAAAISGLERRHFMSVSGWDKKVNAVAVPPYSMPIPAKPDEILSKYSGPAATVDATLTMYATVCRPADAPNYRGLLEPQTVKDPEVQVALKEGLLLNYYLYFPGATSDWLRREGDWAGVSLLVDREPGPNDPQSAKPVLFCYFKKIRDIFSAAHWEYFVPGDSGFIAPKDVTWVSGPNPTYASSPLVLVSRGRHNCYPDRGPAGSIESWTVSHGSPWGGDPDPAKIDKGDYTSDAGGTITGSTGWDEDATLFVLALLFPPFGLCPTASGRPRRYVQANETDTNKKGGPQASAVPADAAPQPGYTTRYTEVVAGQIAHIEVRYVDTNDLGMKDRWSYHGSWGAAELEEHPFTEEGSGGTEHVTSSGRYGGAWRPNLAAWFMWNLFFDRVHGAGESFYKLVTP